MLQRPSREVVQYLDRAASARERAQNAPDPATRDHYERMEHMWMTLAASAAFVERVDLFLETVGRALPPCDVCSTCVRLMRLSVVETSRYRRRYSFECGRCGDVRDRELLL